MMFTLVLSVVILSRPFVILSQRRRICICAIMSFALVLSLVIRSFEFVMLSLFVCHPEPMAKDLCPG